MPEGPRVALFGPSLAGGGAERFLLTLAGALADAGVAVDLVVASAVGPLVSSVPPGVRLVDLGASRMAGSLFPLVAYLRRERPVALLAVLAPTNCVAVWARVLANRPIRLILSERNSPPRAAAGFGDWRGEVLPVLMRWSYPRADAIVTVSTGVADDLAQLLRVPRASIEVLHNPVVTPEKLAASYLPAEHPWLRPGAAPVVVGVGRLTPQKDFGLLIRAFAALRRERMARLIILGEGPDRAELVNLVRALDIDADVDMPGFVDNPWTYLRHAAVFVLSSRWEGLPAVLIEAMACGVPVVATDCASGPAEILERGRWGLLTPVGDEAAMVDAIRRQLDTRTPDASDRAAHFSVAAAAARYHELLVGDADPARSARSR